MTSQLDLKKNSIKIKLEENKNNNNELMKMFKEKIYIYK